MIRLLDQAPRPGLACPEALSREPTTHRSMTSESIVSILSAPKLHPKKLEERRLGSDRESKDSRLAGELRMVGYMKGAGHSHLIFLDAISLIFEVESISGPSLNSPAPVVEFKTIE